MSASLVKELRQRTGAGILDCKKALEACDNDLDSAIEWLRENGIAKAAKKGGRIAAEGLTKVVTDGNRAVIFELNSETDFVAKNEQFLSLLDKVGEVLVNSSVTTLEDALQLEVDGDTLEKVITEATATIGEKIALRRFAIFDKEEGQVFGIYSHGGGKISTLLVANGENVEALRQVAMHAAAMNPQFLSEADVEQAIIDKEREFLVKEVLDEGKPEEIANKMVEGKIKKFLKNICLVEQQFVVDGKSRVGDVLANEGLELISFVRFEVGEGIEKEEVDFAAEVAAQAGLK